MVLGSDGSYVEKRATGERMEIRVKDPTQEHNLGGILNLGRKAIRFRGNAGRKPGAGEPDFEKRVC